MEIPLKAKYSGGSPGRRGGKNRATANQLRASARKRRLQAKRLVADKIEAARKGITVPELHFRRAKKWQEIGLRAKREREEAAKMARETPRDRYGHSRY